MYSTVQNQTKRERKAPIETTSSQKEASLIRVLRSLTLIGTEDKKEGNCQYGIQAKDRPRKVYFNTIIVIIDLFVYALHTIL